MDTRKGFECRIGAVVIYVDHSIDGWKQDLIDSFKHLGALLLVGHDRGRESPDPGRAWRDCQPHNETLSTGNPLPPKPLCVEDDSIPGVKCAACEE